VRLYRHRQNGYEQHKRLVALALEQWGTDYFTKLLDRLRALVGTTDKPDDTAVKADAGPVEEIARVLDEHFGAVMALFPQEGDPKRT
jgi:hypothetical protein